MVEEYVAIFMEIVKYVPYLDSDDRQVEWFVYGLNYKIRATVWMQKPYLVSMVIESSRYAEDMSYSKGGNKLIGSNQYVIGKDPWLYFIGGQCRPPPYCNRFTLRANTSGNSISQGSSANHGNRGWTHGNSYRGLGGFRGSRGRKSFQSTPPNNMKAPPNVSCWGFGVPHFQQDCPKGYKKGKASMGNSINTHRIHAAIHNH